MKEEEGTECVEDTNEIDLVCFRYIFTRIYILSLNICLFIFVLITKMTKTVKKSIIKKENLYRIMIKLTFPLTLILPVPLDQCFTCYR